MDYIEQTKVFLATKGADFGITLLKGFLVAFIGWQIVKFLSKHLRAYSLRKI
ncbi:MAG: hypothetical protein H7098_12945 [Oligoflexus sp.]|nr:hypothetical protein [Pseudopedobacter sp.]